MKTLTRRGLPVLIVVLLAIQVIPVARTNPPVETEIPVTPEVRALLQRACYDCHSNETVWPWYARVAPVSWQVAHDVEEGRAKMNFSTWNRVDPAERAELTAEIGKEIAEGEMPPWYYRPFHPRARLTQEEKDLLQRWARDAGGAEI